MTASAINAASAARGHGAGMAPVAPDGAVLGGAAARPAGRDPKAARAAQLVVQALEGAFGQALTQIGARLHQQAAADRIAVYESGHIFVAQAYAADEHVDSVRARALLLSKQPSGPLAGKTDQLTQQPVVVDVPTIRRLHDKRVAGGQIRVGDIAGQASLMENRILDMVGDALKRRATDIHLTLDRGHAIVEYRIDGALRKVAEMDEQSAAAFMQSTWVMCDVQDGPLNPMGQQHARLSPAKVPNLPPLLEAIRVTHIASVYNGRYFALRLLGGNIDATAESNDLAELGYAPAHQACLARLIHMDSGLVYFTGQMNSGKSTAIKRALGTQQELTNGERRLITIEDPVELRIPRAIQVPVPSGETPEERQTSFNKVLRVSLRADGNTYLVGETRDLITAELCLEGAMIGHQVFSTFHSLTALGTFDRLRHLGLDEWKIYDSDYITGITSQKLVRKVCPHCRREASEQTLSAGLLQRLKQLPFDLREIAVANPTGCAECDRGYRGRTLIAEVLVTDEEIVQCMREGNKPAARKAWRQRPNALPMGAHALQKVAQGMLSPADIDRVVYLDPEPLRRDYEQQLEALCAPSRLAA